MVRRNVIIGLFGMLAACMVTFGVVGRAYAQDAAADPDDTVPTGSKNNPWTIRYTQEEFNAYNDAIAETGCSTPSLECLVRNTTRFVAIEWVQEIMGPNFTVNFENGTEVPPPPTTLNPNQRNTGIIASTFGLIGQMYAYQPATTGRYVAYVLDTADLAPPAYAQGIGFAALDPILDLWKMFRNVAYFFFIGVFIVIGFMIMFRQKISGQAAITAQQAIPSIIISLILVTFSYAISGFLIDLMYLFMFMLIYLFNFASGGAAGISTESITWNIFELGGNLIVDIADPRNNVNLITEMVNNMVSSEDGDFFTGVVGVFGGLTLTVILAIAVLIGMIKLFFELLKSYASIIMGVIFAPFYLMMGAFPGKNTFVPWFKNMVGNLAAFPIVLLFVMLYTVFTENANVSSGGFMPPYLVGGGQLGVAGYLLGLAIILALPEIVKEVKKRMGASEGGFGWALANAAIKQGREGWTGGLHVPGLRSGVGIPRLIEAQPFSAEEGTRGFKTTGRETALERWIIGTRAARKAQVERYERRVDFNPGTAGTLAVEQGGIVGFFRNARNARGSASTGSAPAAGGAAPPPTPGAGPRRPGP